MCALWLCVGGSVAQADEPAMSVQDVAVLLQVGYKDADVMAEVKKRGMAGKFSLSPAQVIKLRKAGASLKLLRYMGIAKPKQAAPQPVSLQELQGWLKEKKSGEAIQKALKKRGIRVEQFSTSAILALRKQGMSIGLLRMLVQLKKKAKPGARRPDPVTQPTPERRLTPGLGRRLPPPSRNKDLSDLPGMAPAIPRPAGRQAPDRKRPTPPRKRPVTVKTTRWGVRVGKARPLTEHEKRARQRKGMPVARPKSGVYEHVSKFYSVKVPKGWHILQDVHPISGRMQVVFTPESTRQIAKIKKGFWVALEYVSKGDRSTMNRSLLQTARFVVQRYLRKEPGIKEKETLKTTTFRSHKAVAVALEGKAREDFHSLRKRFVLLRWQNVYMQVGVMAPADAFATFAARAEKALQTLTFRKPGQLLPGKRLEKAMTPQKVILDNMPGVVSIMCMRKQNGKLKQASSGSGFVVTSDGYVLTNHHVAINSRTGKPYDVYFLNWDSTTGRKHVKAKFVAAHIQQAQRGRVRMVDSKTGRISVRFQRQHVDIALLKIIPQGTYPTVKLSSVKNAMLGDRVVAMGFPSEGASINTMGNESITTTIGEISRLVRMTDKQINEVQHSAKVAGGNSGGPLFDVHTGAVIGINTWVGIFDKRLSRPGMGLGYYYAIPIDLAWQFFPDFVEPAHSTQDRSVFDWYELGLKWMANQQWAPARRAFLRVIRQRPSMAVAYLQLSNLYLERASEHNDDRRHAWLKLSRRWADRGLRKALNHPRLMAYLARVALEQENWSTATYLLKQLTEEYPHDWEVFLLRALLYNLQQKYTEALADARKVIKMAGKLLPIGHIMRGSILYRSGRYFEGQQAYRQALRIEPNNLSALLNEAMGYTYLKQYDDALSRLQELAKQRKFEPGVFRCLLITYASKGDFLAAWKSFNSMWRSAMLRHKGVDAYALYLGGLLAKRVLSAKVRDRLQWGLWGAVIGNHNRSDSSQRVGLMLAANALHSRMPGLAYAVFQRVRTPLKDKKLQKLYKTLQGRLQRRGISQGAWLWIATKAYPRWPTSLIWELFKNTPSGLGIKTAKVMAKRGFPVPLLVKMLKITKIRKKKGQLAYGGQQGSQGRRRPGSRKKSSRATLRRHRRLILRVMSTVFEALRTNDVELWVAAHDPTRRRLYIRQFYALQSRLRSGNFQISPINPPEIQFRRHQKYGIIALYFFYLRTGYRTTKRYWSLRIHSGRWVKF